MVSSMVGQVGNVHFPEGIFHCLQTDWPLVPLTRPELGKLDDALHVEDNSGLVSKVTGTNQALREQLRTKL